MYVQDVVSLLKTYVYFSKEIYVDLLSVAYVDLGYKDQRYDVAVSKTYTLYAQD